MEIPVLENLEHLSLFQGFQFLKQYALAPLLGFDFGLVTEKLGDLLWYIFICYIIFYSAIGLKNSKLLSSRYGKQITLLLCTLFSMSFTNFESV
jgi:hypothetical protein